MCGSNEKVTPEKPQYIRGVSSYSCTSRSTSGENVDEEAELKTFHYRRGMMLKVVIVGSNGSYERAERN
jgi:hypothetical protein